MREMVAQPSRLLMALVITIISLVVLIFVIGEIYGFGLVRRLLCGMLFWIPLGPLFTTLSSGCAVVPV